MVRFAYFDNSFADGFAAKNALGGRLDSLCQAAKDLLDNGSYYNADADNKPEYGLMDITEDDDCFMVYIDAPGLNKEDISIVIKDNTMVVSATRPPAGEGSGALYYSERSQNSFEREVLLPTCSDIKTATSSYVNGVIIVRIGKMKRDLKTTLKKIPVQSRVC